MATRTISAAGGNWTATGTWVGGVVPLSTDDIVGTASSGQLTVNTAASVLKWDFTNYQNTLTINTGQSLNHSQSDLTIPNGRSFFGSGMTVSTIGTGKIILGNNCTIFNYGFKGSIGNLEFASGAKLFVGTFSAVNFNLSANAAIRGGYSTFSGDPLICTGTYSLGQGCILSGTGSLIMGGTGSITGFGFNDVTNNSRTQISNFTIDTPGTITFPTTNTGYFYWEIPAVGSVAGIKTFKILNGTLVNPRIHLNLPSAATQEDNQTQIDIRQRLPILRISTSGNGGLANDNLRRNKLTLLSNLEVDNLIIGNYPKRLIGPLTNATVGGANPIPITLLGTYSLDIGTMSFDFQNDISYSGDNKFISSTPDLEFNPATHSIGKIFMYSNAQEGLYGKPILLGTPSVATINLGNTSSIVNVDVTNLTFTGQNMYVIGGTLSNTNAINVTIPPATGGGESSHTFVS